MATVSLITPKSFLFKLADIFQNRTGLAPQGSSAQRTYSENTENQEFQKSSHEYLPDEVATKSRLSVSLEDLKVISTALLHYKRSLAKMGEMERAEGVSKIDRKFYEMIVVMETQLIENEAEELLSPVA
ncbi:MAG: hypothetical protein HC880_00100 [Bacteroidia bacterium]|nr:hypothetical protein [Bacteroidia bacterium]